MSQQKNVLALESIVADVYRELKQNERSLIAYKGGHYDSDLFASLGIGGIDLKKFGCPKAEVLINQMVWLETCGRHTTPEGRGRSHGAVDTRHFRKTVTDFF